jgi:hypothetical protein
MRRIGIALAIAAASFGIAQAKTPPKPIAISNAEDLIALPGGKWIIASSMTGGPVETGALYAIDSKTAKPTKLYPTSGAASREAKGCGKEVAANQFAGHGVSFVPNATGGGVLYVVNHGGRESVEIFDLAPGKKTSAPPKLTWTGCVVAPAGVMQNSVAALPSGAFFVTVTPNEALGVLKTSPVYGDVRAFSPTGGWSAVPESEMPFPNGIVASPDGSKLYIGSWAGTKLIELTLGERPVRRALKVNFMIDNLRWGADGSLLAAGHDANAKQAITDCYYTKNASCPVEAFAARIDPAALNVVCEMRAGPTFRTVAINVGDEVWMGSARGPSILRLPSAPLMNCAPR